MPYSQACECLKNADSTVAQLLDALEDIVGEYIYLATMSRWESKAGQELREDVAQDLLKLLVLKKALKVEIENRTVNQ